MANARKDVLDFITNHYEECDEDFQSAMLRYRELFFSRKAATEKSKAIITIRRKAKAPAKAAPEAKRFKAAPTGVRNLRVKSKLLLLAEATQRQLVGLEQVFRPTASHMLNEQ